MDKYLGFWLMFLTQIANVPRPLVCGFAYA